MTSTDAVPSVVIPPADLRIEGSRVLRFEGERYGPACPTSSSTATPARGPLSTATASATVRHRFTDTGTGPLRTVCIHASPVMIQENIQDS